eukprot:TRINITY_DN54978_c0_g1_i1.p1 TRINITY_DN54978_c0_g1~~TRINITY_DN54978_c0_g1_i1.p1  ORF type:complete len:532 (+),score=83.50 TRINITY_DN54978_c0_g1_i1:68-1663(+)
MVSMVPGVPKLDVARVKQTAEDICTVFAPEYAKQFAVQMVKAKLNEQMKKPKPDWKLRDAKPAKKPLKCGYIEKMGDVVKNWKKRYLVLLNEKDDYIAYYYVKEDDSSDPKKSKGKIMLDGYQVKKNEESEQKEFGEFGLKLVPYNERRRTWRIKCPSAAEQEEWKTALNLGCRKAPAPLHKDKVLRKAFLAAYRETRWHFPGWYGPWPGWGGTEEEHLGAMIVDKCEHDFLGQFWATLPSGFLHKMIKNKVTDVLDKTVGAATKAAWKGCQAGVEKAKEPLQKEVDENMEPIAKKYAELMETIQQKATALLQQGLKEVAEPVMKPLAEIMMTPLINAFQQVLKIWQNKMKAGNDLKKESKDIKRYAWSYWLMGDAWHPIQEFTRSNELQAMDTILRGFDRWRFEWDFRESTETLMRKASFTWKEEVEETGDEAAATASVTDKLEHDTRLACTEYIFKLLNAIILEPINRLILPKLKEDVLRPIENALPDLMKKMLDLVQIVTKIIKTAVTDAVKNTVLPLIQPRIHEIAK